MSNIYVVSLGCDKNRIDTEKILFNLMKDSHIITYDLTKADYVLINTCCFIKEAKEESINTIIEMQEAKKKYKCKGIIVCGCFSQRYGKDIKKKFKDVDVIFGIECIDDIADAIKNLENNKEKNVIKSKDYIYKKRTKRILTTNGYYEYLKISEGCSKKCSYCIIPYVKGKYRSYPIEDLVEEATLLVEKGVKELVIIAQDITMYGYDLYGKVCLCELLKKLDEIKGLKWIRLLYCYPENITKELLNTIKESKKIVHYLDIPIQHCNNNILKRMNRSTTKEGLIEKIKLIRNILPDVILRTTLITGFPGETEEEFLEIIDFIKDIKFDKLGCFPYSREEGTKAYNFDDQINDEEKEKRRDYIMKTQSEIMYNKLTGLIGKTIEVMIEGYLSGENLFVGRSEKESPEIDNFIFIKSEDELKNGSFIKVKVLEIINNDLLTEKI